MRRCAFFPVCGGVLLSVAIATAAAQTTASGALGAGAFGSEPASSVDIGLDVAGDGYAFGVGGRVRWVGDGIRTTDWDEVSEVATLIRYAVFERRADGRDRLAFSVAAGELGDVTVGHGSVVRGYSSGILTDHRRLGAQVRWGLGRAGGDVMVDDAVAPRILAARGAYRASERVSIATVVAADIHLPESAGATSAGLVGVDLSYQVESEAQQAVGSVYVDVVGAMSRGAGVHVGAMGDAAISDGGARLGALGELAVHTGDYVPGWFGPLYEIDRLAVGLVREMPDGLQLTARGHLQLEWADVGSVEASYQLRQGAADEISARIAVPHFWGVQLAARGAARPEQADRPFAGAAELRLRLPRRMFVGAEIGRLYADSNAGFVPVWLATVWFGGVLGDQRQ